MAGSRDAGHLTSGQVARLLGVSKGTVLRAVAAETLHAACVMPGGALRFMPAEVERYVQWLRRTRQLQATLAATENLVPILREEEPDAGDRSAPEPQATLPAGAVVETADPPQPHASGWDLRSLRADSTPEDVAEEATTLLALVAESLQVGATCLARFDGGTWLIAQLHDRVGMGLWVGALLPYSPVYGQDLADGTMPSLIVEDLRADARFARDAATADWHVGALTAIPLVWAGGRAYGALCTLHPHARSVASSEIPLLRLAARMLVQATQAAAALAREQHAARQAAVFAAMVEYSDDAIIGMSLAGQIETWNNGATRLYGYTAAEAIGRPISLLAPPDRADELPGLLQRIARGERVDHNETVRVRKGGSRVDVALTISPIRNGAGAIIAASTIARDITALTRTRAERAEQEQARVLAEELARLHQEQADEANMLAAEQARARVAEELVRVRSAADAALRFQASLLDAVGQAMIATDLQGTITYWNRAAEGLYGWLASDVLGRNVLDVTPTPQSVKEAATIIDTLRRGATWSGEFQVQRRDGSTFPAAVTDAPVFDADGRMTGVIGVSSDISARKQAEDARAASEERYRRLVELAQEGIWEIDAEYRTVYVNQKMADLLGYGTAELLGRPVSDFLDEGGRAARAAQLVHSWHDAPVDVDWELLGKGGSAVWVHITASAFLDEHGAYAGGMAMVTDIRRRKQEEFALEQARQQAEDLARLRQEQVEEAEAMSAVSSALAETLEPSRLYALILEQVERLMHCDHTCVLLYQDGWATVAASRGALVQPDGARLFALAAADPVTVYGASGQPALIADTAAVRWLDVPPLVGKFAIRSTILVPLVLDGKVVGTFNVDSFTPHSYGEQHLARAMALGQRVTQALRNVRLFQLEQERARNAEEVARLKDDFVASVSHELRTPLTAILGYAEILEARWAQLDDARRLEQMQKIVQAANRQKRVVEDLLVLSSLERRALAPAPVTVEVGGLVRQARDEVQASYADQHIELDERCDVQVRADPGRALRVLVNLLDNAAKYSPVGCPITVTCAVEDGMGVVRVRDYGSGVPESGRERLFTRFGRVAGSRTRAGRVGTGLGLYLSRRLMEEMGGDLNLEATGSDGSTFRLRLPTDGARGGDG